MTSLRTITDAFSRWMDAVANTIDALSRRLRPRRVIRLVEGDDSTFVLRMIAGAETAAAGQAVIRRFAKLRPPVAAQAALDPWPIRIVDGALADAVPADWAAALRGSTLEIALQPKRFLFRPLELPRQAVGFLDGIIGAHIDRLTPWNTGDAVFGWTTPADAADDRVRLSVVATARSMVLPYVNAMSGFGASSIAVGTQEDLGDSSRDSSQDAAAETSQTAAADASPHLAPASALIAVLTQRERGAHAGGRVRRLLSALILVTAVAALGSVTLNVMLADGMDGELQDLTRKIAARRLAMRLGNGPGGDSIQRSLAQRKQASPSSVLVLEALSKILPDHTYVTELHIEGDKLQLVGITRDAPSLIELIEQSALFSRATFFAPTTQSPGDPGERFHIEARIKSEFAHGT